MYSTLAGKTWSAPFTGCNHVTNAHSLSAYNMQWGRREYTQAGSLLTSPELLDISLPGSSWPFVYGKKTFEPSLEHSDSFSLMSYITLAVGHLCPYLLDTMGLSGRVLFCTVDNEMYFYAPLVWSTNVCPLLAKSTFTHSPLQCYRFINYRSTTVAAS